MHFMASVISCEGIVRFLVSDNINIYIYTLPGFFSRFHEHSWIHDSQNSWGKGRGRLFLQLFSVPLSPALQTRHLDISRAISRQSSPLHIASSRTLNRKILVSKRKLLVILDYRHISISIIINETLFSRKLSIRVLRNKQISAYLHFFLLNIKYIFSNM